MRRLILFRHAKSDWHSGASSDHERPLNRRGVGAATTMGKVIAAAGAVPDKVISSTAVRARTTAELAMDAGRWACQFETSGMLYGASPGDAVRLANGQPDEMEAVMLVGHEPTWSHLTSILTGGGNVRIATATAVAIDFETAHWEAVAPGRGRIEWLLNPRLFAGWERFG